MKVRVTTKTPGNLLNVRAGMTGKRNTVIVGTLPDQLEIDAEETRNPDWFKVDTVVDDEPINGYIRSELVTIVPTEIKVDAVDDNASGDDQEEVKLDLPVDADDSVKADDKNEGK